MKERSGKMDKKISIAIDGPAGAGKSTIAKKVAGELGYTYIDTGAIYRTMAYYFIERGMDVSDEVSVSSLCDRIKVGIRYLDGVQHVFLGEDDVSDRIRTSEVGAGASKISAYPAVRASLLGLQRSMAENDNVVMDGRDIGSVVLPDATVKIYLTASVEERARRRYAEYVLTGHECDVEKIKQEIEERDHRDMTREISPLVCAPGAEVIDSSNMTIDEVCEAVFALVRKASAERENA